MVSIKSLNVLVSPILACFSLQKRTVQVLIRQCFLSLVQNEIGGSDSTCSYRISGDGIENDLVLETKARSIPALGNAQGTRKPIRSKQLPSSHRSASGPKGPGVERWEESGRASSLSSSKPRPLALAGMDRTVGA